MKTKWRKILGYLLLLKLLMVLILILHLSARYDIHGRTTRTVLQSTLGNFSKGKSPKAWKASPSPKTTRVVLTEQSRCPDLSVPKERPDENTWLPVDENRTNFVYSAYFLEQDSEIVVIGAKTRVVTTQYCQVWYKNENGSFRVEMEAAKVTLLPEHHGLRYLAVLIKCPLSFPSSPPIYVSLVEERCDTPLNLLIVRHVAKSRTQLRKFTVCLAPLNSEYSGDYGLVEWIELNRILGADKFVIYNYSSASNVARVLDLYSERGLAEVIQWRLPLVRLPMATDDKQIEIHYFGQVAALNDCLYRNKFKSEFIVILDLDEFIIPRFQNVSSWTEMLNFLKKTTYTYVFRNTFFKREWDNAEVTISNRTKVDKYQLITLQKLQREKNIFPGGRRSKYFTRPSDVSSVMIHTVESKSTVYVSPEIALLHHYRDWGSKNDTQEIKVIDKTVPGKYDQELIRNVETIWRELDNI